MEAICLRLKGVGKWLQVERAGVGVGLRAAVRAWWAEEVISGRLPAFPHEPIFCIGGGEVDPSFPTHEAVFCIGGGEVFTDFLLGGGEGWGVKLWNFTLTHSNHVPSRRRLGTPIFRM